MVELTTGRNSGCIGFLLPCQGFAYTREPRCLWTDTCTDPTTASPGNPRVSEAEAALSPLTAVPSCVFQIHFCLLVPEGVVAGAA